MKTAVSILLGLIMVWFGVSYCYGQDDSFVLKVGFFDFPGLTSVDKDGKPTGLVNEITMKTLERSGLKYTIERYPAARFYEYLAEGKIHVFNGLSSIASVKKCCVSSTIPLFPLEMRVYSLQGQPPVTVKEDLIGHSVILVRGFTYKDWGAWIRSGKNNIVFYETDSHEAAFEMLQSGRADYLLNYKYIDEKVLDAVAIPRLVVMPLFRWQCYFNVNKDVPGAEKILKQLELSYEQMVKEGKLRKFD